MQITFVVCPCLETGKKQKRGHVNELVIRAGGRT